MAKAVSILKISSCLKSFSERIHVTLT